MTRLVAAVIDSAVVSLALVAGYAALAAVAFLVDPRSFSLAAPAFLFSLVCWLGVLVLYLTVTWTASGRTYGSLVMGLRVVGPGGRRLRLPGALVRAVLYAVFPAGLLWCAVSRERRSVQDILARTSVIYDWQPRVRRPRPSLSER